MQSAKTLTAYSFLPNFVDLDITEDLVKSKAHHLSGSAGLGGMVDSHMHQQMMLQFRQSSCILGKVVTKLADWLTNSFLPWTACRALMEGCMVALGKFPGVHPLGIGETVVLMHQTHYSCMWQ
jgi:hypothetical protein